MRTSARLLVTLMVVAIQTTARAQSVTILNNGNDARACYWNATQASTNLDLPYFSDSPCTRSLELDLTKRDLVAVYVNRGIIRVANKDYQNGFADYQEALSLDPNSAEVYVNIGNLYFLGENYDNAIRFYNKALDLNIRQRHVVYLNRGMVNEKLGRLDEAQKDYESAIAVTPDWVMAQQKLEHIQNKRTRLSE